MTNNYKLRVKKEDVNKFCIEHYPKYWNFFTPHNDDTCLTFGGFLYNFKEKMKFYPENLVFTTVFSRTQWTDPEDNYKNTNTSLSRINEISGLRNHEATSYYDYLTHTNNYLHQNMGNIADHKLFDKNGNALYNNCPYSRVIVGCQDAPIRGYKSTSQNPDVDGAAFGDWSTLDYMCCGQFMKSFNAAIYALQCHKSKNKRGVMFTTSAVGGHVDHFITREAVIAAAFTLGKDAQCDIIFGLDNPYSNSDKHTTIKTMEILSTRLGGLEMLENSVNSIEKTRIFVTNYQSQQKGSAMYVNNLVKGGVDVISGKIKNNKEYLFLWKKENFHLATKDPSWHGIDLKNDNTVYPDVYNKLPDSDLDTIMNIY